MNQVGKQHLVSKTMRLLSKKTIICLESVLPYLLKLLVMKISKLYQNLCLKALANVYRSSRHLQEHTFNGLTKVRRVTFGNNKAFA